MLVGLEREGQPVVGAINIPAMGDFLVAAQGLGCTWNGRPCRVSAVDRLEDALLVVTSMRMAPERYRRYERLASRTQLQRTWADCYGSVLVATGRAEIALDPIMNPWDCAAVLPILEEAGGHFTDWQGRRTIWSGEGLATNAALHRQALELLRDEPDAE